MKNTEIKQKISEVEKSISENKLKIWYMLRFGKRPNDAYYQEWKDRAAAHGADFTYFMDSKSLEIWNLINRPFQK